MMAMADRRAPHAAIALGGNLDFGTVPVGARATRTLTITNTGNSPLDVNSLALPAGFRASFTAALAAGGSQQIVVTFARREPADTAASSRRTATRPRANDHSRIRVRITDATRDTDFDRDAATDIAIFRPSRGGWFILRSGNSFIGGIGYTLGGSDDTPVAGDYDGDGKTDIAVYRAVLRRTGSS